MSVQHAANAVPHIETFPLPSAPRVRRSQVIDRQSVFSLNKSVKEKLGQDYQLKTWFGEEIQAINEETIDELATCYMTVFNESWGES